MITTTPAEYLALSREDRDAERIAEHSDLLELGNDDLIAEIVHTAEVSRKLSHGTVRREDRPRYMRNLRRHSAALVIAANRGLSVPA